MNENQENVNETNNNEETELNQNQETVKQSELNASSTTDVKNEEAVNEDKSETNKVDEESETSSQDEVDENQESDEVNKSVEDDKTVPYKRFKEVNEKYQELKAEFEALKESNSNKQDVENAELQKYKDAFNNTLESKLNEIPESYRDLIPNVSDFEKMKWIDNAVSKGLFKKDVVEFGNKVNNPSVEEKSNDVSFIKNLSRKF
jgi:hypothetical protein